MNAEGHSAQESRDPTTCNSEQRLGEDQLVALVQERLPTAHKTGALATKDLERVRELLQIHSTKAIAGTITHRSSDPSLFIGDRLRCRTSQNGVHGSS
jgi:hypothetical protein